MGIAAALAGWGQLRGGTTALGIDGCLAAADVYSIRTPPGAGLLVIGGCLAGWGCLLRGGA